MAMTAPIGLREADPGERRVLDAALRCIARWGLAKTTLDDIAREAGVSRATVYRLFPGGKDVLMDVLVQDQLAQFFTTLGARLEQAGDLEELLVTGITTAARALHGHAALQFLLAHEPEAVLPHVAFGRFDVVLGAAAGFLGPWLTPHTGADLALRAGEWVTRLVVSYTLSPSPSFDFTDESDVGRFAAAYLLPGLRARAHLSTV
jgi:AcrR family transcriptional regulator